ncbi:MULTISPECIES: hypothetical protein [unclassified Variovorax]|uniref:hypothetical protein n=1 Tax=unclassified Variovorax TaxID=663243 RepID=UPI00076D473F|nr:MULTISPECIES: hypothetical protein [unclassified Variovorax]KWT69543.1 hypothetical protein APY03_6903 [Variovorax sp. WDL1]PNG48861.1 hypothetical protein CHC06_06629 [Variovorax sp. B2]PNG49368.1 hypothetical protein CHC07_06277 [Variovorax sp. B4]VTV18336.1 hypothetical protein WDL1P2_00047 [Variovorax sp. WDL1]
MATQNRFSAAQRAQLEAMLAEPEVVEVHGNDTAWKSGVVGAIMATAAMSFAPAAHADSPSLFERTISNVVSSVATNAVTTGVRNVMNEGVTAVSQGTRDLVKGTRSDESAMAAQNGYPASRTIFNTGGNLRTTTQAKPSLAQALGIGRTEVPQSTTELAEVMVRNDVGSIAATSKLRPVLFPVVISPGDAYSQFDEAARRAAAAVPPAGQGGQGLLRDSMMQARVNGPTAMMYMGEQPSTSACLIVVHASQTDFAQRMSQKTGLSPRESMDFAVLHEAAHCAQQGEAIAAAMDAQTGRAARARQRISVSGLVDVHTESAIRSGNFERMSDPQVADKSVRSSERYADAFAALAMNAQQPLNGQQWNGIASWRINAGGHDSSNFIRWVQDQVQRDPRAREAMRSTEGGGYNAQAIASFLKPVWKTFEAREMELEQNRQFANQSTHPAERAGQVPAERVSLAAQFGIRPAGEASGVPQRSDPRGYTDEDMQQLQSGAPRLR